MIDKLCALLKRDPPKRDPESQKLWNTLKDTFNAFDKDGSLELGYEEYVDAWKFLGRGNDEQEIKAVWDSVDIDGSGLIDWTEFVFSLMGERALEFGPLAQLETLYTVMSDATDLLEGLRDSLEENQRENSIRAERNAQLRERMESMKYEMGSKISVVMNKMLGVMGLDPKDVLTDDEINKLLIATFEKFDTDKSKRLEKPEFLEAWRFLGLKGDEHEILTAFDQVDIDSSGFIDRDEFVNAIKSSRSTELSLSVLLEQMDGHLEGMDGFF